MKSQIQYEVLRDSLDGTLEQFPLDTVLETLANVCWLKSERLETDYKDAKNALLWRKAGRFLERAAQAVPVTQVSIHAKRYPATAAEQHARWQRLLALCKEVGRENEPAK